MYAGCPCFVHMGLRRDIRQRYNIEGSGGSDLYVIPSFLPSLSYHHLTSCFLGCFRIAGARNAAWLARSRKNPVKSSSRSKASLPGTTHEVVVQIPTRTTLTASLFIVPFLVSDEVRNPPSTDAGCTSLDSAKRHPSLLGSCFPLDSN